MEMSHFDWFIDCFEGDLEDWLEKIERLLVRIAWSNLVEGYPNCLLKPAMFIFSILKL